MYGIEFTNRMPFKYRVEDLQLFYYHYQSIMKIWEQRYTDIQHVVYEDLVTNFESSVRSILSNLGVPFQKQCLEYYNHPDDSLTASRVQVRCPIYTSSIGRYKNYLPYVRF